LSEFSVLLIILFASQSYLDNLDWHAKISQMPCKCLVIW